MLFNYKREGYLAGRGSIVTEVLPDAVKEDVITEGMLYTSSIGPGLWATAFIHATYCSSVMLYSTVRS